jgi:predicted RNA-binding protein
VCLATVYPNSANGQNECMRDVARIDAEGPGFWFIGLFGERKFIEGAIQTIKIMDGHLVMQNKVKPTCFLRPSTITCDQCRGKTPPAAGP